MSDDVSQDLETLIITPPVMLWPSVETRELFKQMIEFASKSFPTRLRRLKTLKSRKDMP